MPNRKVKSMKRQDRPCPDTRENNGKIAPASPVAGLNDNLEFMGRQLHVQTESVGSPAVRIVTHVFCDGRVLLTRKSDDASSSQASGDPGTVLKLMHSQHLKIIQEIRNKQARILNAQ
jgi:hypothetical protein